MPACPLAIYEAMVQCLAVDGTILNLNGDTKEMVRVRNGESRWDAYDLTIWQSDKLKPSCSNITTSWRALGANCPSSTPCWWGCIVGQAVRHSLETESWLVCGWIIFLHAHSLSVQPSRLATPHASYAVTSQRSWPNGVDKHIRLSLSCRRPRDGTCWPWPGVAERGGVEGLPRRKFWLLKSACKYQRFTCPAWGYNRMSLLSGPFQDT